MSVPAAGHNGVGWARSGATICCATVPCAGWSIAEETLPLVSRWNVKNLATLVAASILGWCSAMATAGEIAPQQAPEKIVVGEAAFAPSAAEPALPERFQLKPHRF